MDFDCDCSWLKIKQSVNSAMFTSCIMLHDDLRKFADIKAKRCTARGDFLNTFPGSIPGI